MPRVGKDVEWLELFCTVLGDVKRYSTSENRLTVLKKLNTCLSYDPIIPIPWEKEENSSKMNYKWIFIATLFVVAQNWKLPKCPWWTNR